ncbi:MAG: long-chain-fatty-acid--CoA ligase [Gammaproteobacteria bacterium]|nr:long-chain-fatty-acid--CoA ligase [Gammaproteobacteria bacterium]
MEKPWLGEYPPGVPATLDLDPTESVVDVADRALARFASRPAFSNFGHTISYREFDVLHRRFATWLQSLPGVGPGDRVAIMLPNLLQYPVALFGIWRAGMVVVNINPLYTPPELEHQLTDSGAKVLIVLAQRAGVFVEIQARVGVRHVLVTQVGDLLGLPRGPLMNFALRYMKRNPAHPVDGSVGWSAVQACSPDDFRQPSPPTGADLACLQYTGGTTGRSRGAMLTHANLVANIRQINTWFAARSIPGQEIMVTPLPLYHVYALMCNCLCYVDTGGHNILITDPRNLKELIAELRRWKFTAITGVNTLYQALVQHPDITTVDFSSLKLTSAGGMAVLPATAKRWMEITGSMIHEGYGLSETSPVVTSNPITLTEYNGSIGLPLPNTVISLRNDDLTEVAPGESGEICVQGPQVMLGYWNDSVATASAMTSDGFLRTGDIGVMDERGYFRVVDRKKDMIDVSGLKVYPNEIESAITHHPAVLEAACVGVHDDRTGEAVKLFLVLKPGQSLTVDEARTFLRDFLAPYKIPRHVEFRDSLPKSNVGKILRRELRA